MLQASNQYKPTSELKQGQPNMIQYKTVVDYADLDRVGYGAKCRYRLDAKQGFHKSQRHVNLPSDEDLQKITENRLYQS
jgi:hypothetical protein